MGLFGTGASSLADITLFIQTIGFIVLFSGGIYAKSGNILKHTKMAEIAVLSGVIALTWMVSSLIDVFSTVGYLTIFHAIIGSVALMAGILFVFNKLIQKTIVNMRVVFLLWTVAFFLGIAQYYTYYT